MSYRYDRSWALKPSSFFRAPGPDGLTPFDYQHAGVEYRLSVPNGRHGLIGDAPGVGKTCEGILTSNILRPNRTLVTCPASLILNWEREIQMWSNLPRPLTYPILKGKDGVSYEHDYVILSFDMLRNSGIRDAILGTLWDHWICDEAHALKDPKGNQRTKVMCAPDMLPSVVGHITLMSGTFMPNQPIEMYNAIRLTDWETINCASLEDFRETYYEEGGGFVTVYNHEAKKYEVQYSTKVRNQPRNIEDLHQRLRERLMVRRLKADVLPQLPPKQWHLFPLQLTKEIKRVFGSSQWERVESLFELDPDEFDISVPIDGAVSTAFREFGEAIAPQMGGYIEQLILEGTEKIVVGAWHHTVLEYLRERLDKYGLVFMDGRTSARRKQYAVDQFQTNPDISIILGQIMPLGEGWTLTEAQDVVFAEFFWVPGKNDQMLDRIHRPGQEGEYVLGHLPYVPGTISERVLGSNVNKSRTIHAAMDARITT